MGTIKITLTMPATDFVEMNDIELRFVEDGTLRKLSPEDWEAYFPGCSYPKAYKRIGVGSNEVVWWGTLTTKLMYMANAAGFFFHPHHQALDGVPRLTAAISALRHAPNDWQRRYGPTATAEDTEPPTVWTLTQFLLEVQGKCAQFPAAKFDVEITREVGDGRIDPAGDAQLRSMTYNEIRRAYDRGEID